MQIIPEIPGFSGGASGAGIGWFVGIAARGLSFWDIDGGNSLALLGRSHEQNDHLAGGRQKSLR